MLSSKRSALLTTAATAASVGVSFVLVALPPMFREFTRAGLEGDRFRRYYELFVPILCLFLVAFTLLSRGKSRAPAIWRWIVAGALAGYVSGFFSGIAFDLLRPGGWSLIVRDSSSMDSWIMRIGYPLVSLNWLVGLLAACLEFMLLKWLSSEHPDSMVGRM
jgi:hypothetical protein